MNLNLTPNETADLRVPGQQAPWQVTRLEQHLILQTDAIEVADEDWVAALRGCLVANTLQGGEGQTRFFLTDARQLALEQVTPFGPLAWDERSIQAGIERLAKDLMAARAAAAGVEGDSAEEIDIDTRSSLAATDPSVDDLQTLHALEGLADGDPALGALLSVDSVQGCAVLEPDDESWSIGVAPAEERDALVMSAVLMPLPDGPPSRPFLERALSLGAATVIGPDHWIGCDPAATVLGLNTVIRPHLMSADEVGVAVGGLLLRAQRLTDALMADGAGMGIGSVDRHGLAPTVNESLSMYGQIRA